jgi:hypothetical protein
MDRLVAPFSGLLMLIAACGQQGADADTATRKGPVADGFLGPVTYRYDPVLLTSANVRIAVPAREDEEAYAVKLLPARGIQGSPDVCPGGTETCPVEVQPGLTLALLERPFERYQEALQASELGDAIAATTVAGTDGLAVDAGTEGGLEVEYRLVPVDNRALLIMRQRDNQSPEEKQALADVVASIELGD